MAWLSFRPLTSVHSFTLVLTSVALVGIVVKNHVPRETDTTIPLLRSTWSREIDTQPILAHDTRSSSVIIPLMAQYSSKTARWMRAFLWTRGHSQ